MSSAPDRAVPVPPFEHTRIHGAGFLGLSMACALRARSVAERIELVDPDPAARSLAADLGFPVAARASIFPEDPDLVILAAPPRACERLLPQVSRQYPAALITDVLGVKRPIATIAEASAGATRHFVGSHPLTGGQEGDPVDSGGGHFIGSPVAICPVEETPHAVIASVERLWQLLGGRPALLTPEQHDRYLAVTGHLPVLAAGALARAGGAATLPGSPGEHLVGAGFRDAIRAAGGGGETWAGVLTRNADWVVPGLRQLVADLSAVADRLEAAIAEQKRGGESKSAVAVNDWLESAARVCHRIEGE